MTNQKSKPGEGFAFFRWHALKWPNAVCSGNKGNFCVYKWTRCDRG